MAGVLPVRRGELSSRLRKSFLIKAKHAPMFFCFILGRLLAVTSSSRCVSYWNRFFFSSTDRLRFVDCSQSLVNHFLILIGDSAVYGQPMSLYFLSCVSAFLLLSVHIMHTHTLFIRIPNIQHTLWLFALYHLLRLSYLCFVYQLACPSPLLWWARTRTRTLVWTHALFPILFYLVVIPQSKVFYNHPLFSLLFLGSFLGVKWCFHLLL